MRSGLSSAPDVAFNSVDRVPSRVVLEELDRVLYLPQLANVWERIDSTYDEHELIIDAIRARDPNCAEQAALDHILPNMLFVVDVLTSSPGLRTLNVVGV